MNQYKLLTPGPLTTTDTVKAVMQVDHCTWDDDYKQITQRIRAQLLALGHVAEPAYTAVLMQGSGTFGVEAVLTTVVGPKDKVLIAANGAYGLRMTDICRHAGVAYTLYEQPNDQRPEAGVVAKYLAEDPAITHVAMVHGETTSGILNDVADWGIDFLVSSANKCIQGVPGFSFILANREKLAACAGQARSLSLDLYDQWKGMEDGGGKWRFTSPTHVVLAFDQALKELEAEGGIPARHARYDENQRLLAENFQALGFRPYLDPAVQGPIITSFCYPEGATFTFDQMYHYIKDRGYVLYPGKVMEADTFRVGNIGEIYPEDIVKLSAIVADFLQEVAKK